MDITSNLDTSFPGFETNPAQFFFPHKITIFEACSKLHMKKTQKMSKNKDYNKNKQKISLQAIYRMADTFISLFSVYFHQEVNFRLSG